VKILSLSMILVRILRILKNPKSFFVIGDHDNSTYSYNMCDSVWKLPGNIAELRVRIALVYADVVDQAVPLYSQEIQFL